VPFKGSTGSIRPLQGPESIVGNSEISGQHPSNRGTWRIVLKRIDCARIQPGRIVAVIDVTKSSGAQIRPGCVILG
jgi:hypothetical protein